MSRGAIAALLTILAGCPKTESDPPPKATLTVAPATQTIAPNGAPVTFTATLTNSSAAIGWSIVPGTCAASGRLDPVSGEYTPPATNDAACTFKVRATAGALTADATVTLSARFLRVAPASPAVDPGDAEFSFTVEQAGLTGGTTWTADDGTCGAGTWGTFDVADGSYLPPASNAAACAFTVTATVDGLSASTTAGLSAATAGGVTTLAVSPASGAVTAGSPTKLIVFLDSNDATTVPTCSLSPDVGTCVEAADAGGHTHAFEVTAPAGLLTATTSVEATFTLDPPADDPILAVVPVTVRPSVLSVTGPATIRAGAAVETYTVTAPDVTGETITWTVVPAIGSIADGVYTSPATYTPTTVVTIVATIGEARGTTTVTLVPADTAAGDGLKAFFAAEMALFARCYGEDLTDELPDVDRVAAAVQSAVNAGRLSYDATANAACVAAVEAASCDVMMRDAPLIECIEDGYVGNVANGGACSESIECSAGFCDFPTGTCPGTCTALRGEGGDCSSDSDCAAGLTCDGAICVAVTTVAEGQPCALPQRVCAAGSYCDWDAVARANLCTPLSVLGGPCGNHDECVAPYVCDLGAEVPTCKPYAARGEGCATAACNRWVDFCDPVGPTCAALPILGEQCANAGGCAGDAAFCDTSLATPICAALPAVGGDCTLSRQQTWPACAGGAVCDLAFEVGTGFTGTCVDPIGAGGICEENGVECVAGHYCNADYPATGTCVPVTTDGLCEHSGQCAEGYYCTAVYPAAGNCAPRKAGGDSCTDYDQCGTDLECMGGICSVSSCY